MAEFFVVSNSFAAPIISDRRMGFYKTKERNPSAALLEFMSNYDHPSGLFSAYLYYDANDYHKLKKPLASFLSKAASDED
jgi:hypothetical protein